MNIKGVVGIMALMMATLLPVGILAQDETGLPERLLVGALDTPPFSMKTADGR